MFGWLTKALMMAAMLSQTLDHVGVRVTVLFFVASDCPVSNRTFPEMKRVREEFAGNRAVRVLYVYAITGENEAGVAVHQRHFDLEGEAVLDRDGSLTRLAGAKATPEAVVLGYSESGWHARYAGRVDDRYVRLGLERSQVTQHFAEDAVQAVLRGRPVKTATGPLVGCGTMR